MINIDYWHNWDWDRYDWTFTLFQIDYIKLTDGTKNMGVTLFNLVLDIELRGEND